jgi:NAD(P)-dependent dehydrogenase (short-subunit alcohol dehydrogenase family)
MPAEQRTALVTGGSGGLGEAIARALHDAGHTVLIVHSPGNASIGAWLKTQAGEGYDFAAYGADVADHASCQELAGLIQADGHHIDILVNNAGITRDATFRKLSYADWDAVLRVNLDSVFNVTRPFIDGMLEQRLGPDHQHLLDQRLQGAVRPDQLLRRKSRHAWLHKSPCTGSGAQRCDGQHRLAGVSGHEDGDEHDRGRGQAGDRRYSR